jgi:hypothetical protein
MRILVIWHPANDPPPPASLGVVCSEPHVAMVAADSYSRVGEAIYNHKLRRWQIVEGRAGERVTMYSPKNTASPVAR